MLISDSKNFIFIHNYKVAGSSVGKALDPYSNTYRRKNNVVIRALQSVHVLPGHYPFKYPFHITARELKAKMGVGIFNSYYKFGFVRNPWDWQVSLYTFMLKNHKHPQHRIIKNMTSFDQYIEWRVNNDLHLQMKAFCDEDGNLLVDFIGKFENLHADFEKVCRRLKVEAELPHLNRSRADHDFLKHYSEKSLKMVAEGFREDIERFNYSIPSLLQTN